MSRWTAPSSATIDRVCAQPFSVVHLDMHSIWDSHTEIEAFKEDTVLLVYTLACQHFPLLLGENRFKPCSAFKDFSRDSVINCFSSLFPKIKATCATIQMWIWFYFLTSCEDVRIQLVCVVCFLTRTPCHTYSSAFRHLHSVSVSLPPACRLWC